MGAFIDITNKRYSRWRVISRSASINKRIFWRCVCDCGKIKDVSGGSLKSGKSHSCGCYNIESAIERATIHGMTKHPLFKIWQGAKSRCYNKNVKAYPNYGGRGIKVCDRWQEFRNFYDDMFSSWVPKLTLDRIDVNGDYSFENCKWIEKSE